MTRYDDKITALNRSIIYEPSGRKVVRTDVFVRSLAYFPVDQAERALIPGRIDGRGRRYVVIPVQSERGVVTWGSLHWRQNT